MKWDTKIEDVHVQICLTTNDPLYALFEVPDAPYARVRHTTHGMQLNRRMRSSQHVIISGPYRIVLSTVYAILRNTNAPLTQEQTAQLEELKRYGNLQLKALIDRPPTRTLDPESRESCDSVGEGRLGS